MNIVAKRLLEKKTSRWSQDKNSALRQLRVLQIQAAVRKGTRSQLEEAASTCEKVKCTADNKK